MEALEPIEYKHLGETHKLPRWTSKVGEREFTIYYIDNDIALDRFWKEIAQSKFVAMDTERDIIFNPLYSAPVARVRVITLCTAKTCFVISVSFGAKDDQNRYLLHSRLVKLFEGEAVIKVGFGLEEDWHYVVGSFAAVNKDGTVRTLKPKGCIDLRCMALAHGDRRGLGEIAEDRIGWILDKSAQQSRDWKVVPLSEHLLDYAAHDGIATRLLAEQMLSNKQ
jgi:ribonuclease D